MLNLKFYVKDIATNAVQTFDDLHAVGEYCKCAPESAGKNYFSGTGLIAQRYRIGTDRKVVEAYTVDLRPSDVSFSLTFGKGESAKTRVVHTAAEIAEIFATKNFSFNLGRIVPRLAYIKKSVTVICRNMTTGAQELLSVALIAPVSGQNYTVGKSMRDSESWTIEGIGPYGEGPFHIDQDGVWSALYGYAVSVGDLVNLEDYITPIRLGVKPCGFTFGSWFVKTGPDPVTHYTLPTKNTIVVECSGGVQKAVRKKGSSVPLGLIENGEVSVVYSSISEASRHLNISYTKLASQLGPRKLSVGQRVTVEGRCIERLRSSKIRKNWHEWKS